MNGKTVFITGASQGIGFALAEAFLADGWMVSTLSRTTGKLIKYDGHHKLQVWRGDITIPSNPRIWIEDAIAHCGPPDVLINNAGVGSWNAIEQVETDWFNTVQKTNLRGPYLCTQQILGPMRSNGGGYIINMASILGTKGAAGASAYCVSKYGVLALTECILEEERKNNIRATAICPSFVPTAMVLERTTTPPAEMIQLDDIVKAVFWLLSLSPNVVVRQLVMERMRS